MSDKVFKQDLSGKEDKTGFVFIAKLLFRSPVAVPEKEIMEKVMGEHLGEIDLFWNDENGAGIAAKEHICHFKDADVPPQLMITSCTDFDGKEVDDFCRSQFWDCRDCADDILENCKYQVIVTDMLAAALEPLERANLDMDFIEALLELYPQCEGVYFLNAEKLYPAESIRQDKGRIPRDIRYIQYAVNVRFFNIQGTEDKLIDTLGMSVFTIPDLQYHFHTMNPDRVVYHAKDLAWYLLSNNNPIKNGDTVDSIDDDGNFNRDSKWRCGYEEALIQPKRDVIDIYMNEFAAGRYAD